MTNNTDTVNGVTTSPAALKASPGPDGISLREAITAVDNQPSPYTINFAAHLLGSTIQLGNALPDLTSPALTIDGDIQGSGTPGITIAGMPPAFGLVVKATDVTVYAVAFSGFPIGILFTSTANGQTFSNESALDNSITGTEGIVLEAGHGDPSTPTATHNNWSAIQIMGNSLSVTDRGIRVGEAETIGDDMSGLTIARNTVHFPVGSDALGIEVEDGYGAGSSGNHVHSILVAGNTVTGGATAIRLAAGDIGANNDQLDHAVVSGNTITLPATDSGGRPYTAIDLQTGDSADTRTLSPTYGSGNVMSNVGVYGNTVTGQGGPGIVATAAFGGGTNNQITTLDIEGNSLGGVISTGDDAAGVALDGGQGDQSSPRTSSNNEVTNSTIAYNTITLRSEVMWSIDASVMALSGVALIGGWGEAQSNLVSGIRVLNNTIDSDVAGITLLGGFGRQGTPTTQNTVTGTTLSCNSIPHIPTLISQAGTKGISLVGGVLQSTQNIVSSFHLINNDVAGVPDDASRLTDVGQGAVGNSVDPIPPGQPTGVTPVAGDGQINLTWTRPASDGGSAITGYRVTPYLGTSAQPVTTFNSTATSQTVTGLTNGRAYTFTLAAINAVGVGPASSASQPDTPLYAYYFTWYDHVSDINFATGTDDLQVANLSGATANLVIHIPGIPACDLSGAVAGGGGSATYNCGTGFGGPVTILSDQPIEASQRVKYSGSFNEVKAMRSTAASTSLVFTWYDKISDPSFAAGLDDVHVFNPGYTASIVNVHIPGSPACDTLSASIPPGVDAIYTCPTGFGGPVTVTATNGAAVIGSQRVKYGSSFNEAGAQPPSPGGTTLIYTWYDRISDVGFTSDDIHVFNPNNTTATVTVHIPGNGPCDYASQPIAAGTDAFFSCPTGFGGPATVNSDLVVVGSQRVKYYASFNEVSAVAASAGQTIQTFPYFDAVSSGVISDNIHVVNPGLVLATIQVRIPGCGVQNDTLAAGTEKHYSCAGGQGGPVTVSSNQPVTAGQRVKFFQSFNEVAAF